MIATIILFTKTTIDNDRYLCVNSENNQEHTHTSEEEAAKMPRHSVLLETRNRSHDKQWLHLFARLQNGRLSSLDM